MINIKEYKDGFIIVDRNGNNIILKYKGFKMRYIDYTLKESLKLFKQSIKENI